VWPRLLVKPSKARFDECKGKVIVMSPEELLAVDAVPDECVILVSLDG